MQPQISDKYETVWDMWDRTITWTIKRLPYGNYKVLDKVEVRKDNPVWPH